MPYNPFTKAIGASLDLTDPERLQANQVGEGYYVEYKGAFQSPEKTSHSLASFSNTHGGWLFVGIEADKERNTPTAFPGIDLTRYPDPIAKVRDIARYHVDPMPVLLPQLVRVDDTHAVLAICVPEGEDAPYITRDGRIYRRAADSSEPIHEDNRHALDRLLERGREAIRSFDNFCRDERSSSRAEAETSWAEVYLSPYPRDLLDRREIQSAHCLAALLAKAKQPIDVPLQGGIGLTMAIPFTHVQTCVDSVSLRQVHATQVAFNALELELFTDGRGKILMPLEQVPVWDQHRPHFGSQAVEAILKGLAQQDAELNCYLLRFIDLQKAWNTVGWALAFYLDWLTGLGWQGELVAKIVLTNIWRSVPFLDHDSWAGHVGSYGLPVCMRASIMFPAEGKKPLLLDRSRGVIGAWAPLGHMLSLGLGLPLELWLEVVSDGYAGLAGACTLPETVRGG